MGSRYKKIDPAEIAEIVEMLRKDAESQGMPANTSVRWMCHICTRQYPYDTEMWHDLEDGSILCPQCYGNRETEVN